MAKVIFLHLFVILFTRGGGGIPEGTEANPPRPDPPRSRHTPREQAHPCWSRHSLGQTPPDQTPPGSRAPLDQTPRDQTPPGSRPPREADCGIQSTSGRYASYWNAFLFFYDGVNLSGRFKISERGYQPQRGCANYYPTCTGKLESY